MYNRIPPHPNLLPPGEKGLAATFAQSWHIKARRAPTRLLIGGLAAAGLWIALLSAIAFAATIATDDFESSAFTGGTGWLAVWQTSGSVDIVQNGDSQSESWHMRLRAGDGIAYRDVDLTGWSDTELTVWVRAKSFEDDEYATLMLGSPGSLVEAMRWDGDDDDGEDEDEDDEDDDEYHLYTFELSAFNPGGVFRVQFESHMGSDSDELFVDSLVIASEDETDSGSTLPAPPPSSTSLIVLDGEFDDWAGRANIVDSSGDSFKQRGDILSFYWGDNESETIFWMVERPTEETKLVIYAVHLDMNNNGDFNDDVDRIIEIQYQPRDNDSRVDVKVRRADNNKKLIEFEDQDWGESKQQGGSRVEFGVPTEDLQFSFGAAFRMYVESNFNDRAPDTGDIQWSPMPILGFVGMGLALGLGGVAIWWFRLRKYEGGEVPKT